jgi:hypothetical protein
MSAVELADLALRRGFLVGPDQALQAAAVHVGQAGPVVVGPMVR